MKRRNRLRPLSLMKTEMQKEGSAHTCEGPPHTDKRWKNQTLKLLNKRVESRAQQGFRCACFCALLYIVGPDQALF